MGIGDDLMFLGEAERIHKRTGKKIVPKYGSRTSPLFENVKFIAYSEYDGITVNSRDTNLPSDIHVDYYTRGRGVSLLGETLLYRQYKPRPFKVRLHDWELAKANKFLKSKSLDEFIIINPDYKSSFFAKNKNWGFHKWKELTNKLSKDFKVLRIRPGEKEYNDPDLDNSINIVSPDLRFSIALMSRAKFGVTYDGLLQHIFAGFKIPAVVIQGGLINEKIMSYDTNIHISYDHPETPCGALYDCPHCYEANRAITVEEVYKACQKLY